MSLCASHRFVAAVLMSSFLVPMKSAVAQEPEAATLEEVLVTAQKRSERLQDVPISITAVGADAIVRTNARNLTDITSQIPNLSLGLGDNKDTAISIRGIGDYTRNLGYDARTSVYIDGVFVGQSQAMNQSLLDLQRVEVLRGPQGTLFGKNTISGAINLITRKPREELGGEAGISFGNYDARAVYGILNLPLVRGKLFAKLSAREEESNGYILDVLNGRRLNGQNQQSGRLQLRYIATDSLEFNFSADALRENVPFTNAEAIAGIGEAEAPGPFTVSHNTVGRVDRNVYGTALTADYQVPVGGTVTSISAYRWSHAGNFQEEDYTSAAIMDSDFRDSDRQFTQELRYASPTGGRFDYVAGLYYIKQNLKTDHSANGGSDFAIPGYAVRTFGTLKSESFAAYLNANLHFGDGWTASAGVRYTDESKHLDYNIAGGPPLFIDLADYRDRYSEDAVTPRFGLSYHFNPDQMLYATYSRGFKSGGWNADFITTTERLKFAPEFANSYEVGYKGSLFAQRLQLGIALFTTHFADFQVSQFVPTTVGTIITLTNAGKVTSKGAEAEISALVADGLRLSLNVGYVDATFDSFKDAGGPGINYDGHRLPYAPKLKGGFAIDYTRPLFGFADFDMRADYAYTDSSYSNPNNMPDYFSGAYGIGNLRVGLVSTKSDWSVHLYVRNLTDKLYSNYTDVSFLGVNRTEYGRPRTYGAQLSVKF